MHRLPPFLLLFAACTGDGAQFSKATDTQLARAFAAGSGGDASGVVFIGMAFSGSTSATTCPRTQTTGDETVILGGCDDPDTGYHWDGKVVADNLPGFLTTNPEYDATAPSKVSFEALHVTGTDSNGKPIDTTIDGTVKATGLGNTGPSTIDSDDLAITSDGVTVTEQVHFTHDPTTELITTTSDSTIDIGDLGTASIDGSWKLSDPASGTLTLHGADDVSFDLSSTDAQTHCVDYAIGDQTGQVCPPSS